MNLQDYRKEENAGQTIMAVGKTGTGKSIAMYSFPGPILGLSLDNRVRSVAEWYPSLENIEVKVFTDFEALNDEIDSLESYCPYKTIILDPITNLSSLLLHYSFSLRGIKDEGGKAGSKGKKKGIINLTTIEDFGVEHQGMEQLLANLKLVGKIHKANIIFIAHLLTTTYMKAGGEQTNIVTSIVTAGRKIATILPTQFDEIYHFFVDTSTGTPRYMCRTYNDGIVDARTSFPNMPPELDWTGSKNFYEAISKFYGGE